MLRPFDHQLKITQVKCNGAVQVTNLRETSSGEHKLKISALAVMPFNAAEGYAFSLSVWKPDEQELPMNFDM